MSVTLAFARTFHDAVSRLDKPARLDVLDALDKVSEGLPSAHIHKLENSPFVAFSVNRNALRVICERAGEVLHLLWVDAHDDAYAWAKRHRTLQVGHHVRTVAVEPASEVAVAEASLPAVTGPLAAVRDRDLARFHVPASVCPALRVLSDDGLLELADLLRPPLGEALLDLAIDPDRISQVWLDYHNRKLAIEANTYREPSAEEAARSEVNAGQIWLPSDGQQAVQDALAGDFEAWRVFLHPSQRRLVTRDAEGAMKVTGGPGTGKTVVALHRARHLLERVFPTGRVVLTTYNRTLARHLQGSWDALCADAPALRERADVRTLTQVAQEVLRRAGRPHALLVDDEIQDACWQEALAHDVDGLGRAFLASEREHVVGRAGAWSEASYLGCRRARGRRALNKAGRLRVWACLRAYDDAMAARGGGDGLALAREAVSALSEVKSPWDAVICDELQDASADDLRLLAALTSEGGKIRSNALFLCGDAHQRLYASTAPLTQVGIDVRGRSRVLRLNYRTTEGIRAYAVRIAERLDPSEPDAPDEAPTLPGYRSLRAGPAPEEHTFPTVSAEADWIRGLGAPLLVLTRTRAERDALAGRLRERGEQPVVLEGDGEPAPDGVTLCTLHRAKGLEASRVVIAGRQAIPARWPGGDASDKALWLQKETSLLYVGVARARDWCALSNLRRAKSLSDTEAAR